MGFVRQEQASTAHVRQKATSTTAVRRSTMSTTYVRRYPKAGDPFWDDKAIFWDDPAIRWDSDVFVKRKRASTSFVKVKQR